MKLIVLLACFAYASAGLIPIDDGLHLGGILAGPKLIAAPAISAGATSYQNSNLLALHPTPVVTKVAAPIAAPIVTKLATPLLHSSPALSVVAVDGHYGLGGLGGLGGIGLLH